MSYIFDRPVAGEAVFVGRAVLLRTLETGMAQRRSYAVFGGPKSGRTSLLQQLVHQHRMALRRPNATAKVVPVYLDLATCAPRAQIVTSKLWDAICDAVLDPYVQTHDQPPRRPRVELLRTTQAWDKFHEVLDELWQGLANTPGWCRYSLLLDNADILLKPDWRPLYEPLAALMAGSKEAARPLAGVFAGLPALSRLMAAKDKDAPFKGVRSHVLAGLREAEVTALLRAGGLQRAGDVEACLQAAGGHPQVLQAVLATYCEKPEEPIDLRIDEVVARVQPTFEQIMAAFPPATGPHGRLAPEHGILHQLFAAPQNLLTVPELETQLGLLSVKEPLDFLEAMGVVERSVRGSSTAVQASGALWNDYYSRSY